MGKKKKKISYRTWNTISYKQPFGVRRIFKNKYLYINIYLAKMHSIHQ